MAGTEICRRLRRDAGTSTIPIMMITARGEEIDRVVGFELGADDYLVKPFSPRELVLRVGAVLRRATPPVAATPTERDRGRHARDRRRPAPGARRRRGGPAHRALEFKLLYDLASRLGRVQTREGLLERVWGYAPGIETRTVDTHVKRLREKLGSARDTIETLRGVGYRMRSD